MTLIQIKLINGEPMGRPVNPKAAQKVICDAWTGDSYPKCSNLAICDCEKYRQFEQSVTTYPAPGLEDWEVEAELQWQAFSNGDWIDFNNGYSAEYYYKDNIPTRQIWRLSPSLKEAEVKPQIMQRLEKVEKTVTELAHLVNQLAIAVRKRLDAL